MSSEKIKGIPHNHTPELFSQVYPQFSNDIFDDLLSNVFKNHLGTLNLPPRISKEAPLKPREPDFPEPEHWRAK